MDFRNSDQLPCSKGSTRLLSLEMSKICVLRIQAEIRGLPTHSALGPAETTGDSHSESFPKRLSASDSEAKKM